MYGNNGWGYYVPTQLYEALFLFLLFTVLTLLLYKKDFEYSLPVYLASYGIWRFIIEFARADDRGAFIGSLTPSQTLSLVLVALSVPAYFILKHFLAKKRAYEASLPTAAAETEE